jgi:hypothetical protein
MIRSLKRLHAWLEHVTLRPKLTEEQVKQLVIDEAWRKGQSITGLSCYRHATWYLGSGTVVVDGKSNDLACMIDGDTGQIALMSNVGRERD